MNDGNPNNKQWNASLLTKIGSGLGVSLIALALSMANDLTSLIDRLANWKNAIFLQDEAYRPLTPGGGNDISQEIVEDRAVHQPTNTWDIARTTTIQQPPQTAGNPPQHQEVKNVALAKLGATAEILTKLPKYALSKINVEALIDGRTSPVFSVPVITENLTLRITLPTSEIWAVSAVSLHMPKNTDTREMPRNVEIGEIHKAGNDCAYFQKAELKRGTKENRISFPERLTQQICIDIKTNWGSSQISMSEIEIEAVPVLSQK
jgi:hypothetical protein